jgi:GNAT superfamily N-acetyltransferase
MKKANILLVHPPVTSPAAPPWDCAVVAGSLSGSSVTCIQYDANLDFFLHHVFSRQRIHRHWQMIQEKKLSGIISEKDFQRLEGVRQRIETSNVSIDFFKTPAFYDPETLLVVKKHVNDLLLYFSYAFYPHRTLWRAFFSQAPSVDGDSIDEDQDNNPFWRLCKERLESRMAKVDPDAVVVFISLPDQVMAAKTMAAFIKSNFPEKRVMAIKEPRLCVEDSRFFDHSFSMGSLDPFFSLIGGLYNIKIDCDTVRPDFKGLPLGEYLSPDRVLPVQTSFFKDKAAFGAFLSAQKDELGVKGLILEGDSKGFQTLLDNGDLDLFFSGSKSMDDVDDPDTEDSLGAHCPEGLKMVCWTSPQKEESLEGQGVWTQALWDLSRQGIWNHVKIFRKIPGISVAPLLAPLFSLVASNPNIVHSFENHEAKTDFNQAHTANIDAVYQSYTRVKPLPGEPFWKILEDPVYLLLYLNKYTRKDLSRLWADQRKGSVIRLGSRIEFYFKRPDDLDPEFLDEICRMVEAGGSVDLKYVRYNLERAWLIGYAMENGVIVGNSSLKHPRKEFIQRINRVTHMDFTDFLERGYTSVRPEYRALGVGARLLKGLTEQAGGHKIFSIISEDNTATQKIALRNKTRKIATYYSEKAGKDLGVWMPEQMIESDGDLTP